MINFFDRKSSIVDWMHSSTLFQMSLLIDVAPLAVNSSLSLQLGINLLLAMGAITPLVYEVLLVLSFYFFSVMINNGFPRLSGHFCNSYGRLYSSVLENRIVLNIFTLDLGLVLVSNFGRPDGRSSSICMVSKFLR